MVTAAVARMRRAGAAPVLVTDRHGVPRWNDLWTGNPDIVKPGSVGACVTYANGPGLRPYIASETPQKRVWRQWGLEPGKIYFTAREKEFARQHAGKIIIEPMIKFKASPNKEWGWIRWHKLVRLMSNAGLRATQLGPPLTPVVYLADIIHTENFRLACAVVSRARAVVTTEGALHHAAAACGVPAVVIFGGYISPDITGYAGHRNLFTGGVPCGMRTACSHCKKAMGEISPELVFSELRGLLKES